jgi:phospholipid/cholesterol/gamma-HCH transport system substrate-binding protein
MAERGLRLKLGVFVAGTLIVLAGLVVFFGRTPDLFSNKATYTVNFPEAPGIGPGTPIRKSGVRIGEVNSVDLDPETGQVHVKISVDRKYLPRMTEEATITKGLLSGDAAIDFLPHLSENGSVVRPGEVYPPGSEIVGVPPITPRSLLSPASSMLTNAQQSLDRIVRAFEKLEQLEPKMGQTLDEFTNLARDARSFIPDLKKTNEKIQHLLGADAPNAPLDLIAAQPPLAPPPVEQANIRNLIRDLQDLVRAVRPAVDELRGTVKRLDPDLSAAIKSGRQAFDGLNEVLSPENRRQVNELLKNANGLAVYIAKLATALTGMLESAEQTIKNIDAQVANAGGVITDLRAITRPLALRSEAIVASVNESTDLLNKALTDVRLLLQGFGNRNGTIQKLLSDPTVYQNLDEASSALAKVMTRAEKISRDLEVFSDKIARRPELIGIGGAIHPSSGLKNAPTAPLPTYRPDWPPALPAQSQFPPVQPNPAPHEAPNALPPVQGYPPR